jgi:hypothetical protein
MKLTKLMEEKYLNLSPQDALHILKSNKWDVGIKTQYWESMGDREWTSHVYDLEW